MPTPLDPRKKPVDVKVHVKTGAGVDITWADGHASHYDFAYLRDECPAQLATTNAARKKRLQRPRREPLRSTRSQCSNRSRARRRLRRLATTRSPSASATAIPPASTATTTCARFVHARNARKRSATLRNSASNQ